MPEPKLEKTAQMPRNVNEAAALYVREVDVDKAIEYLRANRDDITAFCLLTFEAYKPGDKSGIIDLGLIIRKLL